MARATTAPGETDAVLSFPHLKLKVVISPGHVHLLHCAKTQIQVPSPNLQEDSFVSSEAKMQVPLWLFSYFPLPSQFLSLFNNKNNIGGGAKVVGLDFCLYSIVNTILGCKSCGAGPTETSKKIGVSHHSEVFTGNPGRGAVNKALDSSMRS